MNVISEPHPGSQQLFLTAPFEELLYHGTRGPGKTDALLMDFPQEVGKGFGRAWRGVLFRETYPQLSDVINKTLKWYPRIWPGAKYNSQAYTWTWPDGEQLLLRHMGNPKDYWNYHGHEYPWIGWEELTNWATSECYDMMMATNRTTDPDVPKRVRATCNPWGCGHHWVKAHFVDVTPPGVPHRTEQKNPYTGKMVTRERTHLFGSLAENTHLLQTDPEYVINLMSIKDVNLRKAWLGGSWDIVAGGYFSDVWDVARNVIQRPWTPPREWECFTAFDWGSASPFSVGFWAMSDGTEAPDGKYYSRGTLIRFDEWFGADPERPDQGLRLTNTAIGEGIKSRIEAYEQRGIEFSQGPADPSIWAEDGGPSIYAQIRKAVGWDLWGPADNSRLPGWQSMRGKMEGDPDKGPSLFVMSNCKAWLATVPVLQRDERDWEDIDTDANDHAADETRYACTWRRHETSIQRLGGI